MIQLRASDGGEQSCNEKDEDRIDADNDSGPETDQSDLETQGDVDTSESVLDLLLDGVRDPINRLYKVSIKIRNPSTRLGSSRAANFQQIDEDTGIDFLRVVEQADHDHIKSLFLQYQKAKALQEYETAEPSKDTIGAADDDGVWEPIRTVLSQHRNADSFLIRRVANANVRRRRQFAYRKAHRQKLARHTTASISAETYLAQPSYDKHISNKSSLPQNELAFTTTSVTTATNLNMARLELLDNQSALSVSEYAPSSMWQPTKDVVTFPPPPTIRSGDSFFECPYCFTFCPRDICTTGAWK